MNTFPSVFSVYSVVTKTLRRRQQQKIFDVEDEIAEKRDSLVEQLTMRMEQRTETETLLRFAGR